MKKILSWVLALVVFAAFTGNRAQAQVCHDQESPGVFDVTKYSVNISDVSVCTDSSCSTAVSVVSGGTTIDIANLKENNIDKALSASAIPYGTYTHMRIQMGSSLTVAGKVVVDLGEGNQVCVSKSGLTGVNGFIAPSSGWLSGADATPQDMQISLPAAQMGAAGATAISGGYQFIIDITPDIIVAEGSTFPSVDLQFTVHDNAFGIAGVAIVGAPGSRAYTCSAAVGTPKLEFNIGGAGFNDVITVPQEACPALLSGLTP